MEYQCTGCGRTVKTSPFKACSACRTEQWTPVRPDGKDISQLRKEMVPLVEPLMRWLSDNHHPHTTIILTSTSAQLVEGMAAHNTDKFVKD
jgi:hypothetical protein